MLDLTEEIAKANGEEMDQILEAVLSRYSVLYPDWELYTISILKSEDRNKQLDQMITMMQKMKNF